MITGDGLELDEFRLVRLLGKGGMGQVWIGHDTLLDRAVAIKLIGARNPDATARDRFLTEARAVARLQHPNVVTIFRVGTTADGRPYLAQELLRGVSLDHVERPMAAARVRELALGIARGLAAAHRRGILHRDVKPANVMLAEPGTVKLLDFGLAKLGHDQLPEHDERPSTHRYAARSGWTGGIAAEASSLATGSGAFASDETLDLGPAGAAQPTLDLPLTDVPERAAVRRVEGPGPSPPAPAHIITADGVVLGTPRYLAPELWRGEPATVRTDLYALGILLHELAAGDAPYPATDLADLRAAVLAGGAPPVATCVPELGARLAALIDRLIALDPIDRPGSSDEVVHELEAMIGAAGPVPGGNPYRGLRAFEAEHRALFFGRGRDVSTLCELLRGEALVCVAGDSGIGKSSVCRAGVVPAIVAGALDDGRCWRTVALVPGRAPAQALAAALGLPPNTAALPAAERLRACGAPAGTGVLIVVDQLEELITVAAPHEAAAAAELLVAVAAGAPGIKILCTVRGDFLTRVAALPELGPTLARGLHLLRLLTLDDLRETVIGPARATGVRFESEAMVGALVDGAVASGGLPLLQFALAELWDARDHGRAVITQAALDELGGVGGALARHADRVLAPLAREARAAARRLLTRLVSAERTRAVRGHDELVPDGDAAAAAALEALIRGRLVVARETADGGATYELAHEALIHGWHALRGWLDDAAGRRAVLERLTAAATDWDRRGRRADLLWRTPQLAELGPNPGAAGAAELDTRDRAFVAASRRAVRRRRALAIALAMIVTAGIALAIAIPRVEARRARDREIRRAITAAELHLATATAADQRGLALAAQAFAGFDAPAADRAVAEATWDDAVRADRDARRAYRDAAAALEAAVLRDGGRADVRHHMAEVLLAHALVAERRHDHDGAIELVSRLGQYDPGGASRARWDASAGLALSAPRALRIDLHRDGGATAATVPPVATVAGDHLEVARLDPGTYVAVITMADGLVVRDPLRLTRGEQLARTVAPPPRAAIPADFVYVPAGRFLFGSDHDDVFRRDFVYAPPLHPAETAAFLIARHETTMAEWMDYLRSLSPDERARRRPRTLGADGLLLKVDDVDGGGFLVSMQIGRHAYEAAADGHLTFPHRTRRATVAVARLPVSGIDWDDVRAYTAWLSSTGRVPGARPCHEREWERAARGADGRNFPGGVALLGPDDANHDATYDHKPGAMGPDEVGVHPASDSPFGVADLAGNVWEWIVTADGTPVTRGGSWYHGATTALIPNRDVTEPGLRNLDTGLRVCADAPAAR